MSLQKAAEEKFGIKAKIKTGSPGSLIVRVDDVAVFDQKKEGAFPGNDELLRRIAAARERRAPVLQA